MKVYWPNFHKISVFTIYRIWAKITCIKSSKIRFHISSGALFKQLWMSSKYFWKFSFSLKYIGSSFATFLLLAVATTTFHLKSRRCWLEKCDQLWIIILFSAFLLLAAAAIWSGRWWHWFEKCDQPLARPLSQSNRAALRHKSGSGKVELCNWRQETDQIVGDRDRDRLLPGTSG